jgi:hypothetical protein
MDKNKPFGFCSYGEEWLEGYKIIKEKAPNLFPFSSLKYYLLCRAIEIFLKTYLLGKKLELKEIKKKDYGHNINNLLGKAIALNIKEICEIEERDKIIIKMLSPYYLDKEFEYMTEGMQHLPNIEYVEKFTEKLYQSVDKFAEKLLY